MNGIAYIISNCEGRKHRTIFENLCNKSIKSVKKHIDIPIAVLSIGNNKRVKADFHIDGSSYIQPYIDLNNKELHGLIAAELLKTHIHEWSPFDRTLYMDCDAFVMHKSAVDYLAVLDMGYELSMSTCISMEWKDSIATTSVRSKLFQGIPPCFPYWNFGVFGSSKDSKQLLIAIRNKFLKYCFRGSGYFGSCPHAQPAIVQVAHSLSPNHKIFTMPTRYNAHFAAAGGYVFSGKPVILHVWKDVRGIMLQ